MNDETLLKFTKETAISLMQLRARCDALETVLSIVGAKCGVGRKEIRKMLEEVEAQALQDRLIRVEDKMGPGLAADLSQQAEPPQEKGPTSR